MASFKRIVILLTKEWTEFFKSKSWIIVLILPVFIAFLYAVVYPSAESKQFVIAQIVKLPPPLQAVFCDPHLKLAHYSSLTAAKDALAKGKIDGILVGTEPSYRQMVLWVDRAHSQTAATIINAINVILLETYSNASLPRVRLAYLNVLSDSRWLSLPTWLTQLLLMICLLQAAAACADEKERQTLQALIISPLTQGEYLAAKITWHACLGVASLLLTLLLTKAALNGWLVLVYGLLGSMVLSAAAAAIGLFAPSALFARTAATLTYIISTLPIMLRDLSFPGNAFLKLFPSFLVLLGFEQSLRIKHTSADLLACGALLLLETGILSTCTYLVLKKRADF